jgi:hypothetical protein
MTCASGPQFPHPLQGTAWIADHGGPVDDDD